MWICAVWVGDCMCALVEFLRSKFVIQVNFMQAIAKSRQLNEHQLSHGVTAAVTPTECYDKKLSPTATAPYVCKILGPGFFVHYHDIYIKYETN